MPRDAAPRQPRHAAGFMLIEVLVAFAIAILALGVMFEVAGDTLRVSRLAARQEEATVRAKSRLAEMTHGGQLIPGEHEGDDGGGYRWRVRVTPLTRAPARPDDQAAPAMTLYAVAVWITWKDGAQTRDVRLDTETIGEAIQSP